jgi:uncharacterized protein (DUF952 family)
VPILYKIVQQEQWRQARLSGIFLGSAVDRRDGFIHLSDRHQVVETAARHFEKQRDLLLVAIRSERLGADLRWEPSRGGALFPHLYAPLPLTAVAFVKPLPLSGDGRHIFPELSE